MVCQLAGCCYGSKVFQHFFKEAYTLPCNANYWPSDYFFGNKLDILNAFIHVKIPSLNSIENVS